MTWHKDRFVSIRMDEAEMLKILQRYSSQSELVIILSRDSRRSAIQITHAHHRIVTFQLTTRWLCEWNMAYVKSSSQWIAVLDAPLEMRLCWNLVDLWVETIFGGRFKQSLFFFYDSEFSLGMVSIICAGACWACACCTCWLASTICTCWSSIICICRTSGPWCVWENFIKIP